MTLTIGVVLFAGLAVAALGYHSGGFGGTTSAPAGTSAAAGNALLAKHYPQSNANPANLIFSYRKPVWRDPQELVDGRSVAAAAQARSAPSPARSSLTAPRSHRRFTAPCTRVRRLRRSCR